MSKVDDELKRIESELATIYKQAETELTAEWNAYMSQTGKKLQGLQTDLNNLIAAKADQEEIDAVNDEIKRQTMTQTIYNQRYQDMVRQTAERYSNVNQIAIDYMNGKLPKIYNLGTMIAKEDIDGQTVGFMFTIVDEATIRRLAMERKIMLPYKQLDPAKDVPWNVKKINSQLMQGILQGESIDKLAKRIKNVTNSNKDAAIRNARTMTTSAENLGRVDTYKAAEQQGIKLEVKWLSTSDGRTRSTHKHMNGETIKVGGTFSNGLRYPGDPEGKAGEVYNCRCTLHTKVLGFNFGGTS